MIATHQDMLFHFEQTHKIHFLSQKYSKPVQTDLEKRRVAISRWEIPRLRYSADGYESMWYRRPGNVRERIRAPNQIFCERFSSCGDAQRTHKAGVIHRSARNAPRLLSLPVEGSAAPAHCHRVWHWQKRNRRESSPSCRSSGGLHIAPVRRAVGLVTNTLRCFPHHTFRLAKVELVLRSVTTDSNPGLPMNIVVMVQVPQPSNPRG